MDGLKANNSRVTDDNMKNGLLVRRLILHSDILMDQSEVVLLKLVCFFITISDYAENVTLTDEHLCFFTPEWKILRRLAARHEDKSTEWIPKITEQLTDIRCFAEELVVLPTLIKSLPLFSSLVYPEIKMHYDGPPMYITWMETINNQYPRFESLCVDFMLFGVGNVDNHVNRND
ncbi:hypothetical protein BC941DRAFT_111385 [Chlamydoabsidia padenii]|nr:hypothetical protein BC941DRAFT_111385 [Chlamydoabsidia padenii]